MIPGKVLLLGPTSSIAMHESSTPGMAIPGSVLVAKIERHSGVVTGTSPTRIIKLMVITKVGRTSPKPSKKLQRSPKRFY